MSATRVPLNPHAFCALPLVRRAYMGLVVGLAVFIGVLALLREPFRGYLAEVQIVGPGTEGLDLADAMRWLKQADPHVAVIASPASATAPRAQIRMTIVAPLPSPANARLDELAARWLYQYLPDRLQSHRRATLGDLRAAAVAAHAREDAAHEQVELLREQQMTQMLSRAGVRAAQRAAPAAPPPAAEFAIDPAKAQEQLKQLRAELAKLVGHLTDEHPQIVIIRSQIDALERQLGVAVPSAPPASAHPELAPPLGANQQTSRRQPTAPSYYVSTASEAAANDSRSAGNDTLGPLKPALQELATASRLRQAAEQRLSDRMQELSGQPSASDWSAKPARIVTRLGGTPRTATLVLGGLIASCFGVVILRASATAVTPAKILTTGELASVLEMPVLADVLTLRTTAFRIRHTLLSAPRVRAIVHFAEFVIAVAVIACLVSIAVEPSLSKQVIDDPFGALSEVIGRLRGGDR